MSTELNRARERAGDMLTLLAWDEVDELAGEAAEVIGQSGLDSDLLHPMLVELAEASAQMIRDGAGSPGDDVAYLVDITDDAGERVDIDELPPAQRALLRAVLALLEDHPDDASFQLRLAADDPRPKGRLDALVHALLCTSALLRSASTRPHAPAWLAAVPVHPD